MINSAYFSTQFWDGRSPSLEDQEVTTRLVRAGELLGVRVVDHVVVAERGYHSFREMLEAVRAGAADYAVLPIENSIAGSRSAMMMPTMTIIMMTVTMMMMTCRCY